MRTALFVVLLLYALHAVRCPRAALQINNGIREQNRERERVASHEKREAQRDRERQSVWYSCADLFYD